MFARLWKHCPKHSKTSSMQNHHSREQDHGLQVHCCTIFQLEVQEFRFSSRIRQHHPQHSNCYLNSDKRTKILEWKSPTISQIFTQLCCSFSFEINLANWMEKQKGSLIINSTLSQYGLRSSTVYKIMCLIHTLHHQQQTAFSQIISRINN